MIVDIWHYCNIAKPSLSARILGMENAVWRPERDYRDLKGTYRVYHRYKGSQGYGPVLGAHGFNLRPCPGKVSYIRNPLVIPKPLGLTIRESGAANIDADACVSKLLFLLAGECITLSLNTCIYVPACTDIPYMGCYIPENMWANMLYQSDRNTSCWDRYPEKASWLTGKPQPVVSRARRQIFKHASLKPRPQTPCPQKTCR